MVSQLQYTLVFVTTDFIRVVSGHHSCCSTHLDLLDYQISDAQIGVHELDLYQTQKCDVHLMTYRVFRYLVPPPPQPKLNVAQYNQTYCRKVKSISAMDFQYFYFVSIFTIFSILSNKNAQIKKIT